jgi:hypothetical protein
MTATTHGGEHTEHEDDGWRIEIPDHPARTETEGFRRAKETVHKILASDSDGLVKALADLNYGRSGR